MRLAVGTLAVLLTHSVALAEDGAPDRIEARTAEAPAPAATPAAAESVTRQRVPIRVVRVLRDTNQALLYDRTGGGTYLLVTVGEKVGIYTVEAIDEDEVTLSAGDKQVVLAAPDRSWRRRGGDDRERPRAAPGGEPAAPSPSPSPSPGPADPYGAPSEGPADPYAVPSQAPVDPYQAPAPAGPRPADPYEAEIREVKAPSTAEPLVLPAPAPAPAPAPVVAPAPAPAIGPAPAPAPAPMVAPPVVPPVGADPVLSRREVEAALANFGALTVAFKASFTPAGVKVEAVLDGSLFAKAGLRAGDLIASVDGRPLRSLDDVAALYARAGSLRTVTAQVVRGGKPVTLRAMVQ